MTYLGRPGQTEISATAITETFTGNGGTTFTLAKALRDDNASFLEVFVSNVQQQPAVSYSIVGTSLTFAEAPGAGEPIYVIFRDYTAAPIFTVPDAAITESKLSSASVTVNKIGTGAVTNAKLATDAVTNAKLATDAVTAIKIADASITLSGTKVTGTLPVANGGTGTNTLTANNVIIGNGTSAVNFVAPGTTGNVLASDGTTWTSTEPAVSGSLVFLSEVTANNSATVDIETTFDSTFDKYLISVTGLVCQTDGQQLQMLLKIGGSYLTTSTYVFHEIRTQSSATTYSGTAESVSSPQSFVSVHSILGNVGGENASFNLYIQNPSSITLQKLFHFEGVGHTNAGEVRFIRGGGCNTQTGALTGVRFKMASGNVTSGVARLYGIANS